MPMKVEIVPQETTILVVDDTPTNLQVLFDLLTEQGYRVASAKIGQTALQRLRSFLHHQTRWQRQWAGAVHQSSNYH
jgi:response regulator RpfG family c-di-GMP phosphodiesterase